MKLNFGFQNGLKVYQFKKIRQNQKHMIYKFEEFNSNLRLENVPKIFYC